MEPLYRYVARLPLLMRLGFLVLAAGALVDVIAHMNRFDPVAISVPAGTTVAWLNRDNFSHSVQVTGTDLPFLELSPGESGEITFKEPGHYPYVCTFHSLDMKGTVIVTEP